MIDNPVNVSTERWVSHLPHLGHFHWNGRGQLTLFETTEVCLMKITASKNLPLI